MNGARILIIYTGGTIGMLENPTTGALEAFDWEHISNFVPELARFHYDIETITFGPPIDSSDMEPKYWTRMVEVIADNYDDYDGFVLLHGTDTMAFTASALSFMLENLSKPVIFTGSQLPIGDLRTDARENLITSIHLASLKENNISVIQEVGLYFEYKLYRGNRTTKINSENFEAFVSANYPLLAQSGVHLKVHKEYLLKNKENQKLNIFTDFDTNVAIIKIFPGITATILEGMLAIPHLKGVVIETYGSGNAPTAKWFLETLEKAVKKGLIIVNVTQCIGGAVIPNKYETGTYLEKIGVSEIKIS